MLFWSPLLLPHLLLTVFQLSINSRLCTGSQGGPPILAPSGNPKLYVNERHVHLIEIKFGEDARLEYQLNASKQQLSGLCTLINTSYYNKPYPLGCCWKYLHWAYPETLQLTRNGSLTCHSACSTTSCPFCSICPHTSFQRCAIEHEYFL